MSFITNDEDNNDKLKNGFMTGVEFKQAVKNSPYLRIVANELLQETDYINGFLQKIKNRNEF